MNIEELLPANEYNRELEQQVRPPDWANPKPSGRYNLVVIGAGTAGLVTAAGAAGLGAKVALIERRLMGGDCLNVGCVPSKAMISAARVAATVAGAGAFGVNLPGGAAVDFSVVMDRMRRLRAGISHHDSAARFRDLGIDVFLGEAAFSGPDRIEVGGETLEFSRAVIATGSRAGAPPIPGLDEVSYLTNASVFSLTQPPKRLGVIGAGPIGSELAQTFARLGTEVFLIESMHGVLPNEDPDASDLVQRAIERDGVKLLCCGQDANVSHTEEGRIRIQIRSHGQSHDQVVDQLLVAAGRRPNLEGLALEKAGVAYSKKGVTVNERLQTTNRNVYAAGDVASAYQFTHAADAMARVVIQNALFMGRAKASALVIPWCTYTSPEVAHVGLYERQAQEKGIELETFTQPLEGVDRAILDGETEGFVRVHLRKGSDQILGATVVAAHAGDLIAPLIMAMTHGLGLKKLSATIFPYPTQAEAIRKVADQYNRTRLTPWVKGLMTRWLRWMR